jgi:phosphatidylserine/phosphatidylglycerophosphate/cardiolipin synthase-like enzyme
MLSHSGDRFVLKKLCVVLLAASLLVGSGAVAALAYTPEQGAAFNNPQGTREAKHRLAAKLRDTIDSAPKHSVIRIAVYSFDRRDLGDALVAACDRHVAVQVVINDNWISGQVKRLQQRLGTKIDPRWNDRCNPREKPKNPLSTKQPYPEPSFMKVCYRSCRLSGPGNQHIKIYMFSQAGAADNVIMVGSNTMTYYAANTHWNDMFTVFGSPAMFESYSLVFRQLAEDTKVAQPYLVFRHGDLTTEFGPLQDVPPSQDPVARRLAGVTCTAVGGTGENGHTVIRIMMYAWSGDRGRYLAQRVADLDRKGCIVRAILSGARKDVKRVLRAGDVALRSADLDLDDDDETGFGETPWEHFTHEKWMALDGTWGGAPYRGVWTGSENWSNKSLHNDEIVLQIPRAGAHRAYAKHFDALWDNPAWTRRL